MGVLRARLPGGAPHRRDDDHDHGSAEGRTTRGIWVTGHAALGHRRLAIIDLPGGGQPMSVRTPDGDVTLVYSRRDLQLSSSCETSSCDAAHVLRTTSDTEVVLHGYLEWGEAASPST